MTIRFTGPGGAAELEAVAGERLLDAAWRANQPLEGTCNGQIACATCHVLVDPADVAGLPPPSPEEEDMLDLVPDATRTSRLACQIVLGSGSNLAVRLPDASGNRQRR